MNKIDRLAFTDQYYKLLISIYLINIPTRYDIFFNKFNYTNSINENAVESELFKLIREQGYFESFG